MEHTAKMLQIPAPILKALVAFLKKDEAAMQHIMKDVFDFLSQEILQNKLLDEEQTKVFAKNMDKSKKIFVFLYSKLKTKKSDLK